MKKFFLWTHRWFGITIGFYFVLLGLTGSYIVYPEHFEAWLNPKLYYSNQSASEKIDLNQIVASAKAGTQLELEPTQFALTSNDRNWKVSFTGVPGMGRAPLVAFIDSSNYEYLGQQNFRETVRGYSFRFHHDLFMGPTGHTIIAIAGIFIMFLLLGGLYLWWPKPGQWKKALTLGEMKNFLQANLKLHKFFGFYTLLLMIMVTFTGIYISRPDWFRKNPPPRSGDKKVEALADHEIVDLKALNNLIVNEAKRPLLIRVDRRSAQIQVTAGAEENESILRLDARTLTELPAPGPRPFDMRKLQDDLHSGLFWSHLGKALIFISGLLPLFFYITGFYLWFKKSRLKKTSRKVTSHD